MVGQDAVDGCVSEHGEVAAVAFYHDAAFVALDCLVQALGDALEFHAEVVVDARGRFPWACRNFRNRRP